MYASGENTSGSVPAFLMKVWTLVEDPTTDELIYWDASGTSFHVFDQQRFSREILPLYFKHNNIASFIRQLNMYGFRKVAHIDQGGLKIENDDLHFQHPYFQRGDKEMLQHIKRKVSSQSVRSDALTAVKSDEVSRVLTDVNQIKSKQQDTDQNLDYIKRENKLLWREIAALRQKYHKQQEIVNKLIQFLVSLVSSNRTGLSIPSLRRVPLAIDSSSQLIGSTPVATDVNTTNLSEELISGIPQNYTIQSPPSAGEVVTVTSPTLSGPIIHELSETSPNFLNSPDSNPLTIASSPIKEECDLLQNAQLVVQDGPDNTPLYLMQAEDGNCFVTSGMPASVAQSPKIEQAPSLEDALHFDWTSTDNLTPSLQVNFLSPQAPLDSSQGKLMPNQKRKRTKPAGGLSIPEASPSKKSNPSTSFSSDTLMTPDILSTEQANTLDQLVMNSGGGSSGLDLNRKMSGGQGPRGDATLALSASGAGDDFSLSANQLDFLNSDLDGLRGLLQDQYKMDPSILIDLFESSAPWPIVSDKSQEEELIARREEPSTSADITGTEVVQYSPKELFPDLLEDGVIGDIDDID